MIRATAVCPKCDEEIVEKEDKWFMCPVCNGSWWWSELEKLGIYPKYLIKRDDANVLFLDEIE